MFTLLIAFINLVCATENPTCFKPAPANQTVKQWIDSQTPVVTDEELLKRLVLAEGISTNFRKNDLCEKNFDLIFKAIALGVVNRAHLGDKFPLIQHAFGLGLRGVIFHPGQFNPAISRRSKFNRYFLCPTEAPQFSTLWPTVLTAAKDAMNSTEPLQIQAWEKTNKISLISHFYYPLSTQAGKRPPQWADPIVRQKLLEKQLTWGERILPAAWNCIHFFRYVDTRGNLH